MRHNFPKIKCVFLILLICIYCDGGAKKKIYVDVGREQIRRLLIISYGGLSPEHFYMNETPTLNKLRAIGVYAPYMENVVPPTPPSTLQSIVTGMYPSEHGAYGFRFWDMLRGVTENADVYTANRGVLPIWATAEKHNKRAGCMWPGSQYAFDRYRCTYNMDYDVGTPLEDRVLEGLGWFKESNPADIVLMHFDDFRITFENHGIGSEKAMRAIQKIDKLMKYIHFNLNDMSLANEVNVIVVSGHGYHPFVPIENNIIDITRYMRPDIFHYRIFGESPILEIVPTKSGKRWKDYIVHCLEIIASVIGHFNVYTPETLSKKWKIEKLTRIGPIIIIAEPGFAFQDIRRMRRFYNQEEIGLSGYDKSDAMRGTFFAYGPLIRRGVAVSAFHSVDLFDLYCVILKIPCSSRSGRDRTDLWSLFLK